MLCLTRVRTIIVPLSGSVIAALGRWTNFDWEFRTRIAGWVMTPGARQKNETLAHARLVHNRAPHPPHRDHGIDGSVTYSDPPISGRRRVDYGVDLIYMISKHCSVSCV